ncbi:type II toxin-antitoxin system RatA family toxin [Reyranella sp. CPCC 100927]|uniref:type II toxin-antitoxin system RatA family toxin n=1 Tax=Reyranella sp. CPCC 100927 TaxID=2599616 RepID=UPI0011B3BC64|nr:type II toxin-antitoxin system RatA family toxin [Reyranella sp. CPCC 100927]TWT10716.1 type II toxin-antitoxin system RatA family toxin [Reyranella sp. CPCC 100927]
MPTHSERRVLPYTPRQLYDLVSDVEKYPEFLPWCVAARVRERSDRLVIADLAIGFRLFRERFTSKVTLSPDAPDGPRIDTTYADGPFKHLMNHWIFHPHEKGCEIDFYVEFEFRSRLLQATIELLFHEAVRRMVAAFEARAAKLYGKVAA